MLRRACWPGTAVGGPAGRAVDYPGRHGCFGGAKSSAANIIVPTAGCMPPHALPSLPEALPPRHPLCQVSKAHRRLRAEALRLLGTIFLAAAEKATQAKQQTGTASAASGSSRPGAARQGQPGAAVKRAAAAAAAAGQGASGFGAGGEGSSSNGGTFSSAERERRRKAREEEERRRQEEQARAAKQQMEDAMLRVMQRRMQQQD